MSGVEVSSSCLALFPSDVHLPHYTGVGVAYLTGIDLVGRYYFQPVISNYNY